MEKLDQTLDPLTGLLTTSWFDQEGQLHVDYKQDSTQAFEAVKKTRLDGDVWKRGVKNSMVHALHIPDGVCLELRKIGVDVLKHPSPSYAEVVAGLKKIHRFEACDMTGKQLA